MERISLFQRGIANVDKAVTNEHPLNIVDDLFLLVTNIIALIGFWCLLVEFLAKTIWFTSKGERHLLYYQINYTKVNIITIITGKQLIITCL